MSTQPLHERIRSRLEHLIMSGALPPGARLPVEHQLMAEFNCSRMTVSKAITALASAGLVERRKKAGTFVSRPRVHSMMLDIPDLQSQVRERGGDYHFRLLKRRVLLPRHQQKSESDLAAGGDLLSISGLHIVDGRPLALELRKISLNAVPEIADVDLAEVSPGTWLLQHIPWTQAETRLSAAAASRSEAALLDLETGAACLIVERRTWRKSKAVTSVRQIFDGRSYDMVARFGPFDRPRTTRP
jgi:GntR family histidine utilization transcriptional repressor